MEQTLQEDTSKEKIVLSEKQTFHVIFRHLFLVLCILLALTIVVFLVYKNGESIYDKGI